MQRAAFQRMHRAWLATSPGICWQALSTERRLAADALSRHDSAATSALVSSLVSWAARNRGLSGRPSLLDTAVTIVVFGLLVLLAGLLSLELRYRRGDEVPRLQLRWLLLGAGTVPVLLASGWAAQANGVSIDLAYSGFFLAMLIAIPASVAVAVLQYQLFDVDRLLGLLIGLGPDLPAVGSDLHDRGPCRRHPWPTGAIA
ncbi:hypothetical protein AB5J55_43400 [Streptomyces sp. R11]|uniref:Uncharacterized protein n=1 Tax=Streptomyces sp. R11 TaxID=3238625 RepID=A0AB39NC15_9ACTN